MSVGSGVNCMMQNELANQYEQLRGKYSHFTIKLVDLMKQLLAVNRIQGQVEGRVKSIESFLEKATGRGKAYSKPLEEITDLSGLRIILYYQEDVHAVCGLVNSQLSVYPELSGDKITELKPYEFGYRSIHVIVGVDNKRKELPEWNEVAGLKAEIQIRTVLQHAWATISHALQYKREQDVPRELRRRLYRLSGLFELVDDEFSELRRLRLTIEDKTLQWLRSGTENIDVNIVTLSKFVETSSIVESLCEAAKAAGFVIKEGNDEYSEVIELCKVMGITTIIEIERALDEARDWKQRYFETMFALAGPFWWTKPSFLIELLILHKYAEKVTVEMLAQLGWNEKLASAVLGVIRDRCR